MSASEYHFITRWRFEASADEIYDILDDPADLVRWWPKVYLAVKEVEPEVFELHTKGWLPYTLRWRLRRTESDRPRKIALEAWGDFNGRGVWTFAADGAFVEVVYDWRIAADKPLIRRLSFALKPIFSANHRWAMAEGEKALQVELARRRGADKNSALSRS